MPAPATSRRSPTHRLIRIAAPLLSIAACTTTDAPPTTAAVPPSGPIAAAPDRPQGYSGSGYYQAGSGEWGERSVIELQLMPAAWFELDSESTVQSGLTAGSADGWGYGLRAAFGNRDQSIGVLYQGFDLDADFATVELHSVYVDFDVKLPLQEGGGKFALQAAGGLGATWLDYDQRFEDTNEGAAQLRVGMVFEPSPTFSTSFGLGGVWIGHPGETEGYGTFLLLSAGLTF